MSRKERTVRHRPAIPAMIPLAVLLGLCAAWAIVAACDGWAAQALRSRTALIAGSVLLASLTILYVLIAAMWRLARQPSQAAENAEAGSAAVEFALLFPIALTIVLIMVQATLLLAGNLVVHHAGYAAARAAIVWVPESVSYDEPRNVVSDPASSEKLMRIRAAAVYKVLPVSASRSLGVGGAGPTAAALQDGLRRFYELYDEPVPGWIENHLPAKYEYAWNNTDVAIYPPEDGEEYGDAEDLRVRTRHTLYLSVPYARHVFAAFGAAREISADGAIGSDVEVTYTLTNQGVDDIIEVEQFPRMAGKGEW